LVVPVKSTLFVPKLRHTKIWNIYNIDYVGAIIPDTYLFICLFRKLSTKINFKITVYVLLSTIREPYSYKYKCIAISIVIWSVVFS